MTEAAGVNRIAFFGPERRAFGVVGFDVGVADQVDAVRHRSEMPCTLALPSASRSPSSVSLMLLRLPQQVDYQRALPRITATCRDRIAVGTKFRLICRICSPKPGILCAIASVPSRRDVAPCRAGAAGGEHQITQCSTSQSSASVDSIRAVRRQSSRVAQATGIPDCGAQPFLQRRNALVLVDASRGAIGNGDNPNFYCVKHVASPPFYCSDFGHRAIDHAKHLP